MKSFEKYGSTDQILDTINKVNQLEILADNKETIEADINSLGVQRDKVLAEVGSLDEKLMLLNRIFGETRGLMKSSITARYMIELVESPRTSTMSRTDLKDLLTALVFGTRAYIDEKGLTSFEWSQVRITLSSLLEQVLRLSQ